MWPVASSRLSRLKATLKHSVEYINYVVKEGVEEGCAFDTTDFDKFKKITLGYLEYRLARTPVDGRIIAAPTSQHEKWDLIALVRYK